MIIVLIVDTIVVCTTMNIGVTFRMYFVLPIIPVCRRGWIISKRVMVSVTVVMIIVIVVVGTRIST